MTTSLEPIHVRNSLVAGVARGRHSLAEDTTSESYYQLRFGHTSLLTRFLAVAIAFGCAPPNVDGSELKDNLVFYASLDRVEADLGQGDLRLQTAKTLERRQLSPGLPPHVKIVDGGRWGRCLRFSDVSPPGRHVFGREELAVREIGVCRDRVILAEGRSRQGTQAGVCRSPADNGQKVERLVMVRRLYER